MTLGNLAPLRRDTDETAAEDLTIRGPQPCRLQPQQTTLRQSQLEAIEKVEEILWAIFHYDRSPSDHSPTAWRAINAARAQDMAEMIDGAERRPETPCDRGCRCQT